MTANRFTNVLSSLPCQVRSVKNRYLAVAFQILNDLLDGSVHDFVADRSVLGVNPNKKKRPARNSPESTLEEATHIVA